MRLAVAFAISAAFHGSATAAATSPLLVFSSDKVPAVDTLSDSLTINDHASALAHLFANEQICNFDAVIVASAPDFHVSQLRSSLSSIHSLLRRYRNAASSCHLPYLSASASPETVAQPSLCTAAKELAQRCHAKYMQISVGDNASIALNNKGKHVLCLEAASDEEKSENPLDTIATQLTAFTSLFPSHLVTLSSVPTLGKRDVAPHTLGSPAVGETLTTSTLAISSSSSTPLPAENYRLLTSPLILSLGIVFGLVVPLVLVVISALAGIRSPVRESAGGKSRVIGVEKKNQ